MEVPPLQQQVIQDGIRGVCEYFDAHGMTLAERWYVCLCIERSAEAILSEGLDDLSSALDKIKKAPAK